MRVIGLDVGSKTIGVAVSDELGLIAHPRVTGQRSLKSQNAAAADANIRRRKLSAYSRRPSL